MRLAGFHAVALPGSLRAPARPALGFALEETMPDDVRAWAARAGIRCEAREQGLLSLRCRQVPRDRLPGAASGTDRRVPAGASPIDELALTFSPGGRLVSVDAFTPRLLSVDAAASYGAATARLQAWLGPPADEIGDRAAASLASAPLATARARFRFDDYVAIVSASNLSSGVAVREQYLTGD